MARHWATADLYSVAASPVAQRGSAPNSWKIASLAPRLFSLQTTEHQGVGLQVAEHIGFIFQKWLRDIAFPQDYG